MALDSCYHIVLVVDAMAGCLFGRMAKLSGMASLHSYTPVIIHQALFPIRSDWVSLVPLARVVDKVVAMAIDKALVVYRVEVVVNDKAAAEAMAMVDDKVEASSNNLNHK